MKKETTSSLTSVSFFNLHQIILIWYVDTFISQEFGTGDSLEKQAGSFTTA